MSSGVVIAAAIAAGALGVGWLQPRLAGAVHRVTAREDVYALPPPAELRALTLGYHAAATDMLWAKLLVENGIHHSEHRAFPDLDRYIDIVETEMDMARRQEAINKSVQVLQDEVLVIPLHRQVIPWVSRANVVVTHRANNVLQPFTVKIQ